MDLSSISQVTYLMLAFYAIACGAFCMTTAGAKNLNEGAWFIGGLIFGILALIAVAGMPVAPKESKSSTDSLENTSDKQ